MNTTAEFLTLLAFKDGMNKIVNKIIKILNKIILLIIYI